MSTPKSRVKFRKKKGKSEVVYESNVDATQYYLFELSRAALRDVGKFLCRRFREEYYGIFAKHTGDAGRATSYTVLSGAKTQYPRVMIGLPQGRKDGFYSYFQEVGTSKQPRLGLLSNLVKNNVDEIQRIEAQYLSGINAPPPISEADYDGGTE